MECTETMQSSSNQGLFPLQDNVAVSCCLSEYQRRSRVREAGAVCVRARCVLLYEVKGIGRDCELLETQREKER